MAVNDLTALWESKNKALQQQAIEREEYITLLETYLFELVDEDCPNDYKRVVRNEIFGKTNGIDYDSFFDPFSHNTFSSGGL